MEDNNFPTQEEYFGTPENRTAAGELLDLVQGKQTTTPINSQVTPNNTMQYLKGVNEWAHDRYAYSKPFTYGASWRNMNFERYYNSPGFKELGFDPFRDNEAVYNEHTSLWDDFQRAAPQFVKLGYYGSKHMVAPWTADDDAADYQRTMAVGQSSREGVGAFGINLGLNLGYTAGIIGYMAAEEGLLALATVGTAGAASELTVPAMIAEGARAGKTISQSWKFLNSVKKSFDAVKTANDARKIYELSKSGAASVAKFLNPFENVAEFSNDMVKGLNGVDKVWNLATTSKGVGSFVRDLKNIKATWGESNLEGGMAANDEREKLIHDFYDKNGRLPETDEEINDIKTRAAQTGLSTTLTNLGLIYLSNKIVFDTAFKGMPTMKKLLAETDNLGGKIIVGGVEEDAKAVSKYSLRGLKETLKPYNLLKGSLRYSTKNLVEGVQESAQDIISAAYKDYYDPKYGDEHLASYPSLSESFKQGFADQFTKQGWETFASGFLMGGMIQGPQKLLFNGIPKAFHKITDPEGYSTYKKQKEDYINSIVNSINDPRNKTKDYINLLNDNFVNQKRAVKSITDTTDDGDIKATKDVQDEAMFDHIHTLLRTGRESFLKEQLSGLKELNDNELSEAFDGLAAPEARKRIASYENRIGVLKDRYDKVEQQFPNPFNLNTVDKKKNPEGYAEMQLKHNVFNFYKKQIVFAQHTFDRILDRMEGIQNDMAQDKPVSKASLSDVAMLFAPQNIDNELKTLRTEISSLKETGVNKKALNQKIERLNHLKDLKSKIDDYRYQLILRQRAQANRESYVEAQKRFAMTEGAEVRTKDGAIHRVVYAGKKIKLSNGKRYDPSKLEIVSSPQNLDFHLDSLVEKSTEGLRGAYNTFLKGVAKVNNDYALADKLDQGFVKVKDYYALNQESYTMAHAINVLTDPESSNNIFDTYVQAKRELENNKVKRIEEGLNIFLSKLENNDLLNELYKAGVFILPEELKALEEKGTIPTKFLDATTKQEIADSDPRHKKAVDIIKKYTAVVKGKTEEGDEPVVTESKQKEPQTVPEAKPAPVKILYKKKQDMALIEIKSRLDKVTNGEELEELASEINGEISAGEYAGEGVEELVEARRNQLSVEFEFRDIKKGEILILNDKDWGKVQVVEKRRNEIGVKRLDERKGHGTLIIPAADVHKEIKYKYSKGMKTPQAKPLTAKEKELAKQNQINSEKTLSDINHVKRVLEEAEKKTPEQIDKEFFEDLGCK